MWALVLWKRTRWTEGLRLGQELVLALERELGLRLGSWPVALSQTRCWVVAHPTKPVSCTFALQHEASLWSPFEWLAPRRPA